MAAFVRFVFTLLIVGIAVNLVAVLLANARSQRRQALQFQHDSACFKDMLADISGHVRRADLIVESQRVDSLGQPLESTLLVRQYRATGSSQKAPLPVVRITLPGNQLQATGVLLEFDSLFAADIQDYAMLRNTQLVFFAGFCGVGEPAPTSTAVPDPRFTFLPRGQVPELVRLDPLAPQPSPFESKLWHYLWNALPDPPRDARFPWVSAQPGLSIKATWLKPAAIAVGPKNVYTAYVSTDGSVTLGQNEPGMTGLLEVLEDEGKRLPQR
jgi:hypothetical protein